MMAPDPVPDPTVERPSGQLDVDVLVPHAEWIAGCADAMDLCKRAARAGFKLACANRIDLPYAQAEVAILLTDNDQIRQLNRDYRNIDKATNVLSFANLDELDQLAPTPRPDAEPVSLGDIIVAYETVVGEADAENKALSAHMMHLIVHGMLHLLGYDHETEADAVEMEALEIEALALLKITNPYAQDIIAENQEGHPS